MSSSRKRVEPVDEIEEYADGSEEYSSDPQEGSVAESMVDGDTSDDSDDGSPFEFFAAQTIDKLDTVANALVTDDGTGVADVLADIAQSLRAIAKLMYSQRKNK
jgi:hypothetical protein